MKTIRIHCAGDEDCALPSREPSVEQCDEWDREGEALP